MEVPPVIIETRDVIGGGRYLQHVRISIFQPGPHFAEGIRYSLCLVEIESGTVLLMYTSIAENLIIVTSAGKKPPMFS
jgi:hypothetical protein